MQIILREDVDNLGRAGDLVKVKDGFARNFLIPYGKAVVATEGNKRHIDIERARSMERLAFEKSEAEQLAAALTQLNLTFAAKAGDGDRLFGSITAADIAEKLAAAGHRLDKRIIELGEPIRAVGEHDVTVRLHTEVRPTIRVTVTKAS